MSNKSASLFRLHYISVPHVHLITLIWIAIVIKFVFLFVIYPVRVLIALTLLL